MQAAISTTRKGITAGVSFELHEEALLHEHLASVLLLRDSDNDLEVCDHLRAHLLSVLPELLDQAASRLQIETLKFLNNLDS